MKVASKTKVRFVVIDTITGNEVSELLDTFLLVWSLQRKYQLGEYGNPL
jgi:hypothetical protein